jgi:hypothetical protein
MLSPGDGLSTLGDAARRPGAGSRRFWMRCTCLGTAGWLMWPATTCAVGAQRGVAGHPPRIGWLFARPGASQPLGGARPLRLRPSRPLRRRPVPLDGWEAWGGRHGAAERIGFRPRSRPRAPSGSRPSPGCRPPCSRVLARLLLRVLYRSRVLAHPAAPVCGWALLLHLSQLGLAAAPARHFAPMLSPHHAVGPACASLQLMLAATPARHAAPRPCSSPTTRWPGVCTFPTIVLHALLRTQCSPL